MSSPIVPLPQGLSLFDAMALGTAGFTAALAIDRMEQNGLMPGQGPVVVSGASGGVGSIASIGLAGGMELHATVMPFILRGVSILGITSANCPMERRRKVWGSLVTDLKSRHLDAIVAATVTLDELPGVFEKVLSARTGGGASWGCGKVEKSSNCAARVTA